MQGNEGEFSLERSRTAKRRPAVSIRLELALVAEGGRPFVAGRPHTARCDQVRIRDTTSLGTRLLMAQETSPRKPSAESPATDEKQTNAPARPFPVDNAKKHELEQNGQAVVMPE